MNDREPLKKIYVFSSLPDDEVLDNLEREVAKRRLEQNRRRKLRKQEQHMRRQKVWGWIMSWLNTVKRGDE